MTESEIRDFIKYIDPEIRVKFVTQKTMKRNKVDSIAYAMPYRWLICFSKNIISWGKIVTFSVILHELGHIYTGITSRCSYDELRAQLWGIKVAQMLRMHGLAEYMWKEYRDLSKSKQYPKRYQMASKLIQRLPNPICCRNIYDALEYKDGIADPLWLDKLITKLL